MSLVTAVFTVPLIHFFTILVFISLGNKMAIYLTIVCEQNLLAGKFFMLRLKHVSRSPMYVTSTVRVDSSTFAKPLSWLILPLLPLKLILLFICCSFQISKQKWM